MMRLVGVIMVLFGGLYQLKAQNLAVDFSYRYMYAPEWDKAVQTYNFSRPHLTEKQPLLIHGLNASGSYFFDPSRKLSGGIGIGYSFFRSKAENENFANALSLHLLNLGYIFHYQPAEKITAFYADATVSLVGSAIFRGVNGELIEFDEAKAKAFGVGADLNLKAGYNLKLGDHLFIHPFLAVGYTPYLYSPGSERVMNQTQGLSSKNWTALTTLQAGLGFGF